MALALEQHDRLVHGEMERSGGRVFKHTGDGMIAVFSDADRAVAAAVRAVGALESATWARSEPLEIRVAVHAGQAIERDGDFFGPSLNKLARINGVGHGGQVLVSNVARELMRAPAGTDLGDHELRDLSGTVRLWQLDDGNHPPLRTLVARRHNLPSMPTEFVGRRAEVDELRGLLRRHRLVSITGVGGCGKTRLAIEVASTLADDFPGGLWFVDLSQERDGHAIGGRTLGALGLDASSGLSPLEELRGVTEGAETLLLMDNCEHLIDDVAEFADDLLGTCPDVRLLTTSREALATAGERVWRIPNLHDSAVELFVNRAERAGVEPEALTGRMAEIAQICASLDDIPLAIELAGARAATLPLDELSSMLQDRFAVLAGGQRPGRRRQRQQTLQTMMDWSHELLSVEERTLLRELAVFAGSFSLAGAEAVATPAATPVRDRLHSLVAQSVVVPPDPDGRYRLLETVRLYGLDRLIEREALAETRSRHLTWMVETFGGEYSIGLPTEQVLAHDDWRFTETENALAALEWADEIGDQAALFDLWHGFTNIWLSDNRYAAAARSWLERIPEPSVDDVERRGSWLATAGLLHFNQADLDRAFEYFAEGGELVEALLEGEPFWYPAWSPVLNFRANVHVELGQLDAARADADLLFEMADAVPADGSFLRWMAWMVRGTVSEMVGDGGQVAAYESAIAAIEVVSRWGAAIARASLADVLAGEGRFEDAMLHARICLGTPAMNEAVRLSVIPTAALSCARLGRVQDALNVVVEDRGPLLARQQDARRSAQLLGLAAVFQQLGDGDRMDQLLRAGLATIEGPYATLRRSRLRAAFGPEVVDRFSGSLPPAEALDLGALVEASVRQARHELAGRNH